MVVGGGSYNNQLKSAADLTDSYLTYAHGTTVELQLATHYTATRPPKHAAGTSTALHLATAPTDPPLPHLHRKT